MKGSTIVLIGAAGAALLFMSGRKGGGEGGTGGSLDIPALFGTGNIGGDPVVSPIVSQPYVAPSQDYLKSIINADKKASNTPSASSVVNSSSWTNEVATIKKAGFSTEGLTASYDPSTNTIYTKTNNFGVIPGTKPPTLAQATTKDGINWTAVSSPSSSSSSKKAATTNTVQSNPGSNTASSYGKGWM
jgi:hypothetical protein